jgi:intein/homing endonuclease
MLAHADGFPQVFPLRGPSFRKAEASIAKTHRTLMHGVELMLAKVRKLYRNIVEAENRRLDISFIIGNQVNFKPRNKTWN